MADTRDSICRIRRAPRIARNCASARSRRRESTVAECVRNRSMLSITSSSPCPVVASRPDDRRTPLAFCVGMKAEQRLDFGHSPIGAVAIGLVHDEHVGNLHHARLERLHLVSHARHEHENRDISGAGDFDFVLPHADGLDRHEILPGRVEHEGRVGRRARQAAEMPPRRHAADEHTRVLRVRLHAHAIAKHGAAGERTGWIDGEDTDAMAGLAPARDETIDQRALARARRAGNADEKRAARSPEQLAHERGPAIGIVLNERDAACNSAQVAGEDRICKSGQPAEFITDLYCGTGLVQCGTIMKMRLAVLALTLTAAMPSIASADATAFIGRNSGGDDRSVTRGFSLGASMLILGFEFEYANSTEDDNTKRPSLRTTAGNVSVQTFGLPGFQLYATTGGGVLPRAASIDEETGLLLNTGGGIKINIAGPLRVRIDYRVFSLRGNPQHTNIQRIYAGMNFAF